MLPDPSDIWPSCVCSTGFVRWICESLRPFVIAADRGLRYLMKSGRPTMWIPSPSTIARDVKLLFKRTRERIRQRLDVRIFCRYTPYH
jgi:hypothetical protein